MTILNIVILVAAGLFAVVAIISLLQGLMLRGTIAQSAYGVGRQERRRSMLVAFLRAAAFAVIGLILFGVYGLSARPEDLLATEPEAEFTPLATATATLLAATVTPTAPAASPTAPTTATATTPVMTPTTTVTSIPTVTATPPPTAVVTAPAGVYLRETPSPEGTLIEHLLEGTVLILLPGQETVDDVLWRQVRDPNGQEGWIAAELDGVALIEPQ